jgi:anti-anti-sigma factor
MGPTPNFRIHESRMNGHLRLSLTGELDLVTTPVLEDRLARLRARKSPVGLDLSNLDFIDSSGLHLLIRTVGDARIKRWPFRIEPDVGPQIMRQLRLVHLDRFIAGREPPIP